MVLNRGSEASSWQLDNGLPVHVGDKVTDGSLRLLSLGLAHKVDWHQSACLDQGVGQEDLQEVLELLTTLLEEGSLHVTK